MGCGYQLAFPSTRGVIEGIFDAVEKTNVSAHFPEIELAVERRGFLEEYVLCSI